MTLKVGDLLRDRYRIDEVLAQGGMGAIYRASDSSLGIVVAVKENLYSADESSRQFQAEARILANLRHTNLPRVTDHFVIHDQGQYLVMDFISGKDLKEILVERGAISEEEAITIGKAACLALEYLHTSNPPITHRDIKPGNIKITDNNEIYLVDFGLAKQAEVGEQTMTGAQALTPGFAPPEQYGQGTDHRSDIYSLGATLYAAVTVDSPPDGLTRAVSPGLLIDIRTKNSLISPGLETIIRKAMAVSPLERYQYAREMYEALCNLETKSQESTLSFNTSKIQGKQDSDIPNAGISKPIIENSKELEISEPGKKKNYWWAFLLAAVIVIGLGVGLFSLISNNNNGLLTAAKVTETNLVQENEATETLSNQAEDTATQTLTPTNQQETTATIPATETIEPVVATETPTETPSIQATAIGGGFGVIAFASDREDSIPQIYFYDLNTRVITKFTNLNGGACQPDWSPDGNQVVFTSPCGKEQLDYKGSRLFIMNTDGSGLLPLNTLPGGDYDPVWNPVNANLIAFTSYRNDNRPHLYIYHLDDKSVEELSPSISYDRSPVWSPDGNSLAFQTVYEGINQIYFMSIVDMKRKELSKSVIECTSPAWSNGGSLIYYSQGTNLPGLTGRQLDNLSASEFSLAEPKPVWGLDFSPDDYWVAFTGLGEGTNRDIFVMLSNGGLLDALTTDAWNDFDVKWRP